MKPNQALYQELCPLKSNHADMWFDWKEKAQSLRKMLSQSIHNSFNQRSLPFFSLLSQILLHRTHLLRWVILCIKKESINNKIDTNPGHKSSERSLEFMEEGGEESVWQRKWLVDSDTKRKGWVRGGGVKPSVSKFLKVILCEVDWWIQS